MLVAVASRFVHAPTSARPSIGGITGVVPLASTTAFVAVRLRVPSDPASSTSTVRSPANRPWPRTSSMPLESSHGVWVSSLHELVM